MWILVIIYLKLCFYYPSTFKDLSGRKYTFLGYFVKRKYKINQSKRIVHHHVRVFSQAFNKSLENFIKYIQKIIQSSYINPILLII